MSMSISTCRVQSDLLVVLGKEDRSRMGWLGWVGGGGGMTIGEEDV